MILLSPYAGTDMKQHQTINLLQKFNPIKLPTNYAPIVLRALNAWIPTFSLTTAESCAFF